MEVTTAAADQLKSIMERQKKQNCGLRIYFAGVSCKGVGYGLAFEEKAEEEDVVVESNGIKLFIEKMVAEALEGARLDYITTPMGSGFTIANPNAPSTCGSECDHCH